MGNETSGAPIVIRICWWLVDLVSRTLEPNEREAVRGDLAESGKTGRQALRDVLGLVARRQAALWKNWRPWLALLGLVAPLGLLLGLASRHWAYGSAIYAWMYVNNWTMTYVENAGFRLDLLRDCAAFGLDYLTLICWSWTSGFVIGSLSRRAVWINAVLFCCVLFGELLAAPQRRGDVQDPVFSLGFYRSVFPLILRIALVLFPALWGMCKGVRLVTLSLFQTILWAALLASLTARAVRDPEVSGIFGWELPLLLLAVTWPIGYMIATASWRRWRTLSAVAVMITCTSIGVAQSSPQDYPQWRGQNRDGSASGFAEPKVWPEKLTRRWKVEVGEGYATPIVIGKTVYTFTRRDGSEVMMALNAETGKIVWQTNYPAPYEMASPTKAHGPGPKATPLFHNGKLYTLGVSGIVSAFDGLNGKLIWQKPAPVEQPFFGAASSPIADKDMVIVHPGNYDPLTAFDAGTGDVKWTAKEDGLYASPMIVELGGVRQVVSMGQQNIVGVALADGALLWQYPWAGEGGGMQAITPILYGETIIVSSYHMGVKALKPARRDRKWVVEVVWETKDVSMFGLSEKVSGQYFGLDAKTGKVLWLGKPREANNTAVVKAGDLLFLLNDNGELIVARSSRTAFELLKKYTVADSATWAQPAISGNRVFVKDVSSLALWTLN
jgi:outer membrane protein assembly factor BamB